MKITRTPQSLIFEIPRIDHRSSPWDDNYHPEYPCVVGLILHHRLIPDVSSAYTELGFASLIDMGYKGKDDQVGDFIVKYPGSEGDLKVECYRLGLDIIEITI